ncbi:MAG: hypothetical protein NVS3B25_09890 [Hymenobacter sp.]
MAAPPPDTRFRKEDYGKDGLGSSEALDTFFQPLNEFMLAVRNSLNGGLTVGQNSSADLKDITIKVPSGGFSNGYPYASYVTAAGQSIPTGVLTVVNFDTRTADTDNAVTTGAGWKFTVPPGKGGIYRVSAALDLQGATGGGNAVFMSLTKNGPNEVYRFGRLDQTSGNAMGPAGSVDINLNAGDYVQIAIYQNGTAARPLEASALTCWATICAANLTSAFAPSCFPVVFQTTVKRPKGVTIEGVSDVTINLAPVATAIGGLDWSALRDGQISINNIPGLVPGRTYAVRLQVLGG